jgi:hypothetical protein
MLPAAYAIGGCSNASLSGTFGMQLSGAIAPGAQGVGGVALQGATTASTGTSTTAAPGTGIARMLLDGNGNITGYSSVNAQSQWLQGNLSGTYSVNDNCSVSLSLMDASGNSQNFNGIVVAQGNSAFLTQTNAGAGVSGTLRPLKGFCQTSDLVGTFGIQYFGTASSAAVSSTGLLSLDGRGGLTATEWRLSGGASALVTSAGNINVNADCSASLTLTSTVDGSSVNLSGLISLDEKQLFFIQSDAGKAVTGSAVAQ